MLLRLAGCLPLPMPSFESPLPPAIHFPTRMNRLVPAPYVLRGSLFLCTVKIPGSRRFSRLSAIRAAYRYHAKLGDELSCDVEFLGDLDERSKPNHPAKPIERQNPLGLTVVQGRTAGRSHTRLLIYGVTSESDSPMRKS